MVTSAKIQTALNKFYFNPRKDDIVSLLLDAGNPKYWLYTAEMLFAENREIPQIAKILIIAVCYDEYGRDFKLTTNIRNVIKQAILKHFTPKYMTALLSQRVDSLKRYAFMELVRVSGKVRIDVQTILRIVKILGIISAMENENGLSKKTKKQARS